jgi:RhtB (resistance to homoserine/threonine) family protein
VLERRLVVEFATVAGAHLLAVASPGPDLAVVLRQSLAHGRRAAIGTSVGIGTGILLHAAYCLLGLGLILKGSPGAYAALKYAGAAYLGWIAFGALRAGPRATEHASAVGTVRSVSDRAAWTTGFLTNALNPKATLFFVALFTAVVERSTPLAVQAAYGLWMSAATMAWFSGVSIFLTRARVRAAYLRRGHWIDRAMGVVLAALALRLALTP